MALQLFNLFVNAAYDPGATVNFINRSYAISHDVNVTKDYVSLSVTFVKSYETLTIVWDFVVVEEASYEIILGHDWTSWCSKNESASFVKWFL